MAAALDELGTGKITSIDRNPDLPDWIAKTFAKANTKLSKHHELIVSETSYNDELMWLIEQNTTDGVCKPVFDFCFQDGAHTWEIDSCAFFLAEKLLKPGKWMLFDDLTWTMVGSAEQQKHLKTKIPLRLQEMQQVMQVFKLCVAQHPHFTDITIDGDWGWAKKMEVQNATRQSITVRKASVTQRLANKIKRLAR